MNYKGILVVCFSKWQIAQSILGFFFFFLGQIIVGQWHYLEIIINFIINILKFSSNCVILYHINYQVKTQIIDILNIIVT
jgi:hypothetical protein